MRKLPAWRRRAWLPHPLAGQAAALAAGASWPRASDKSHGKPAAALVSRRTYPVLWPYGLIGVHRTLPPCDCTRYSVYHLVQEWLLAVWSVTESRKLGFSCNPHSAGCSEAVEGDVGVESEAAEIEHGDADADEHAASVIAMADRAAVANEGFEVQAARDAVVADAGERAPVGALSTSSPSSKRAVPVGALLQAVLHPSEPCVWCAPSLATSAGTPSMQEPQDRLDTAHAGPRFFRKPFNELLVAAVAYGTNNMMFATVTANELDELGYRPNPEDGIDTAAHSFHGDAEHVWKDLCDGIYLPAVSPTTSFETTPATSCFALATAGESKRTTARA